jgi:hypothetical protein
VQVKRAVIGLFVHSDEPDQRDERGERTLGDEHPETDAGPSPARSTGAVSP